MPKIENDQSIGRNQSEIRVLTLRDLVNEQIYRTEIYEYSQNRDNEYELSYLNPIKTSAPTRSTTIIHPPYLPPLKQAGSGSRCKSFYSYNIFMKWNTNNPIMYLWSP